MTTSPQLRESPETVKLQGCPETTGVGFAGSDGAWECRMPLQRNGADKAAMRPNGRKLFIISRILGFWGMKVKEDDAEFLNGKLVETSRL
jgi:hypothetical protein